MRVIQCDIYDNWLHLKCSLLSTKQFKYLSETDDKWFCNLCLHGIFLFRDLSRCELIKLSFNSNTICLCSKRISDRLLGSLPCLETYSELANIPSLTNIDPDISLPSVTNFNYYSTHELHSSVDIKGLLQAQKSFSVLHWNIRSLPANFAILNSLLFDLNHVFSLIGISETKLKLDKEQISNISMEGYKLYISTYYHKCRGCGILFKSKYYFQ